VKPRGCSWLSLLGFFAVITLGYSLIFAIVLAGVTAAIAGGESAQAAEDQQVGPLVPGQTFSGMITDARCGSRHTDSKNSASDQFGRLAGQRVSLTGVLTGGAIKVRSAMPQAARVGE
jgi:hypothetical protein